MSLHDLRQKPHLSASSIGDYIDCGMLYKFGRVDRLLREFVADHYILLWDYYSEGGLVQKIGSNAGILKQAYTVARVRKEARQKGYRIREKKIDQGVRLVLTV